MKMISSTRTTSTSGVTLISFLMCPAPNPAGSRCRRARRRRARSSRAASSAADTPDAITIAATASLGPALAQDVGDDLRRYVVDVDRDGLDRVGEVVEHHDCRDRHQQTRGGG